MAHLVLPAVTLALPGAAVIARLMRSSILEVSGADYVRTAAAKGLTTMESDAQACPGLNIGYDLEL